MVVDNEILISDEFEFENQYPIDCSVSYFVVCKKNQNLIGSINAFDCLIAGEKIKNWVMRACENAKIIEIFENLNEIEAVLPYLTDSEYTVILNANIPLLRKQKLKSVLQYVAFNRMNVCKIKGGYIFNTEYLRDVCEVLSVDSYNFKSNDFFAVTNFESYEIAKKEINKRIINYHTKNGVFVSDIDCKIDANVQIENGCQIYYNSMILSGTKISYDSKIGKNCIIENSNIGSDVVVGDNVIIKNSEIGSNVKIADGVIVENCIINNDAEIGEYVRVFDSKIGDNAKIQKLCDISNSHIKNNTFVGVMSKLYKAEIEDGFVVFNGKVMIKKSEEDE